jgi:hypothetical protein
MMNTILPLPLRARFDPMTSTVFMIDGNNSLTELSQTDYDSEDLFQRLLADHPSLLASASGSSGRLLLVRREAPVPAADDGLGHWSLDHLYLDGDGVPVLVEVKRATDTRARREVIAQMLDYAANGVAYWPIDQIISAFNAAVVKAGASRNSASVSSFRGKSRSRSGVRSTLTYVRAGSAWSLWQIGFTTSFGASLNF